MLRTLLLAVATLALPAPAQQVDVKGTLGYATYPDSRFWDNPHVVAGGSVRLYLTRRLGIEPEALYMRQAVWDKDYYFVPNVTFDLTGGRVTHYVIGGAGFFRHDPGGHRSWTFGGGYGVKVYVTRRLFIAPEVRLGWEPLFRTTAGIGYTFGR